MKNSVTSAPASAILRHAYPLKRSQNKISLIIADDCAADQNLIQKALKTIDQDIEHTAVFNGQQLIDLLTNTGVYASSYQYHPNAIILDLNMPLMNGLEALRMIRSLRENSNIPVFILHTTRQDDQLNQCSSLGVQGIYTKPTTFNALISILESIFYSCGGIQKKTVR
jgi:CheY-like chemotaxis protein